MLIIPLSILTYIDPNSGGLLFQILATIFVFISGLFLFFASQIKMAFNRLRRFLRDRGNRNENESSS